MDSWSDLLESLNTYVKANRTVAVVTLVHIEGSSYKGLGARMLVGSTGQTSGTISGGCLEADVALHGQEVLKTGRPKLLQYDSRSDEDLIWGLGLGCEGMIQLLIEPFSPEKAETFAAAIQKALANKRTALLTYAWQTHGGKSVSISGTCIHDPQVIFHDGFEEEPVLDFLEDRIKARWHEADGCLVPQATRLTRDLPPTLKDSNILFQPIVPPPELLVCGGGFDTPPLLHLGAFAGWSTTLALPKAPPPQQTWPGDPKLVVGTPETLLENIRVNKRTLVILKSHHFFTDFEYLKSLLHSEAGYIGLLGPKRRTERMFDQLQKEGVTINEQDLSRLYYPVGLDIGAETSEEIALAIFAEMRAFLAGRQGGSLKYRQGPIHKR